MDALEDMGPWVITVWRLRTPVSSLGNSTFPNMDAEEALCCGAFWPLM
jgi:hypothetical protein